MQRMGEAGPGTDAPACARGATEGPSECRGSCGVHQGSLLKEIVANTAQHPEKDVAGGGGVVAVSIDHRPIDHRPINHRPIDHRPIDHRSIDHRPIDLHSYTCTQSLIFSDTTFRLKLGPFGACAPKSLFLQFSAVQPEGPRGPTYEVSRF